MKKVIIAALMLCGLAAAQDFPRYELITGFSYGSMDTAASSHSYAQGWLGGVAANLSRSIGLEAQASAHYTDTSFFVQSQPFALSPRTYSFLAGPRLAHRGRRVTPFVHGLFGVLRTFDYSEVSLNAQGNYVTVPYQSAFGAAAGGGIDYSIGKHVALRTQVDYLFSRVNYAPSTAGNLQTFAALVFTFGGGDRLDAQRARLHEKMTRLAAAQAETPSPAQPSELAAVTNEAIAMKPGEQWAAKPQGEPAVTVATQVAASASAVPAPAKAIPPAPAAVATLEMPIGQTLPIQAAAQVPVASPLAAVNLNPSIAQASVVRPVSATPTPAPANDVVIGRETVYAAVSNPQDANQGLSLGEIARQYRERKKRQIASNE